jgi:hypothetical protein
MRLRIPIVTHRSEAANRAPFDQGVPLGKLEVRF